MGRPTKNDNPDPETQRRRERQRANQKRAVEKKRQAVDGYEKEINEIKAALGTNFEKFNMLSQEIEGLINELRRRNLSFEDRRAMDTVEQRVLELNAATRDYENKVGLTNGSEPANSEPPVKRRRSSRIADQAVPVHG